MCNPASFIVTRDNVFWSRNTDSHEDIIKEFNLVQDGVRGPNIVRVEISPPCYAVPNPLPGLCYGRLSLPIETWRYLVDQDLLPAWYDAADCERRTRAALQEWATARILRKGTHEIDGNRQVWAFETAQVTLRGHSIANIADDVCALAHDYAIVAAGGSARVHLYDNAAATAVQHSTIVAADESSVVAFDDVRVSVYDKGRLTARGRTFVTARDSTILSIGGEARAVVHGPSSVSAYDEAYVRMTSQAVLRSCGGNAVVVISGPPQPGVECAAPVGAALVVRNDAVGCSVVRERWQN